MAPTMTPRLVKTSNFTTTKLHITSYNRAGRSEPIARSRATASAMLMTKTKMKEKDEFPSYYKTRRMPVEREIINVYYVFEI